MQLCKVRSFSFPCRNKMKVIFRCLYIFITMLQTLRNPHTLRNPLFYLNIRLNVILVPEPDSTVHCYLKGFVIQSDHKTFSRVM